jgi:HAD superfamily hydrolase (TIGR01509 family)
MRGVIFDYNGTLFYDTDKHIIAWKRFFLEETGAIPGEDAFKNVIIGSDNTTIFKKLINPDITPEEVERCVAKKEQYYFEACLEDKSRLKLMDGAEDFFKALKDLGIPFGVATGSPKPNIEFYLKHVESFSNWFSMDKNIVYDDYKIKGKPAPDIFLAAAKKVGAAPEESVIFEDSYPGYLAARAAGAKKIIMIEKKEDFHKFENLEGVCAVMENYLDTERLIKLCCN